MDELNYIKTKKLANGITIPVNGFGCYQLQQGNETKNAVIQAIEAGYRHIDTAFVYGNELSVGEAIKECIKRGIVKREDLFITTKLTDKRTGYYDCLKQFDESLNNLGLDYLDAFLIHSPLRLYENEHARIRILDSWLAMENLYNQKKVNVIGVSQFEVKHLQMLEQEKMMKPLINQIELHPTFQQREIVKYCLKNDIAISAWGALNFGEIVKNKLLNEIAVKYNKSVAQIALNWSIYNGYIPLSRTTKKERVIQNFDIFNFKLTEKEYAQIDSLGTFAEYSSYMQRDNYLNWNPNFFKPKTLELENENIKRYKLFGCIPFLSIAKKSKSLTRCYLFGLQFCKIETKPIKDKKL